MIVVDQRPAISSGRKQAMPDPTPGGTPATTTPSPLPDPAQAERWVRWAISCVVLVGFFFVVYVLLNRNNTDLKDMSNVLFTLLGALGAAFTQVMNYWSGSSKGSSDKTQILNQQLANPPAPSGR
jgi:hypothetical protein